MSFKQRERKRKQWAARQAAKRKRNKAPQPSSGRWWLTPVANTTCCARCAGILREGREMVYRHTPREALCVACADADPAVSYRPSLRWERRRA
jgi:hypothetical protein